MTYGINLVPPTEYPDGASIAMNFRARDLFKTVKKQLYREIKILRRSVLRLLCFRTVRRYEIHTGTSEEGAHYR